MQVQIYYENEQKYMVFISKSYHELSWMRKTCKGKSWINIYDPNHWVLTEELYAN